MDSENVVATATQRKNIGPNGSTSNNSVGRNNTTALNGGSSNKNGVRRDEQNGGSNAWASTSAFRQNSGPSFSPPPVQKRDQQTLNYVVFPSLF